MDTDKSNEHDSSIDPDTSYSPASETEMEQLQRTTTPAVPDDETELERVKVLPGTGGPDDVGDIEVDEDEMDTVRSEISDGGVGGK